MGIPLLDQLAKDLFTLIVEAAAESIVLRGEAVTLVVIYTKKNNEHQVITVYPSRRFDEEAERKIKSGRWFMIKGESYEGQL